MPCARLFRSQYPQSTPMLFDSSLATLNHVDTRIAAHALHMATPMCMLRVIACLRRPQVSSARPFTVYPHSTIPFATRAPPTYHTAWPCNLPHGILEAGRLAVHRRSRFDDATLLPPSMTHMLPRHALHLPSTLGCVVGRKLIRTLQPTDAPRAMCAHRIVGSRSQAYCHTRKMML